MPLHLLQGQLGHSTIDMTMRYAGFHPEYGDVARYFDRVNERLGLRAATTTNNTSDHTPAREREEAEGAEAA